MWLLELLEFLVLVLLIILFGILKVLFSAPKWNNLIGVLSRKDTHAPPPMMCT